MTTTYHRDPFARLDYVREVADKFTARECAWWRRHALGARGRAWARLGMDHAQQVAWRTHPMHRLHHAALLLHDASGGVQGMGNHVTQGSGRPD